MDLPTLIVESEAPAGVAEAVKDLIALKATTRELGAGEAPDVLRRYVDDQLQRAADPAAPPRSDREDAWAAADTFFLRMTGVR